MATNSATSQNPGHKRIEDRLPVVREQNGIFTELPVVIDNNLTVNGTISGGSTIDTVTNLAVSTLASINSANVTNLVNATASVTTQTSNLVTTNNLIVASVASINLVSGKTINFNAAAITACGASTAVTFNPGIVGGTGDPTSAQQFGWTQVQVGGTTAWIPIWH